MRDLLKYLFDILGIDASTEVTPEEALRLIRHELRLPSQRIKEDAVDGAIQAGKLQPQEREWALCMAEKNLAVFRAFVKHRAPVLSAAMNGGGRRNKTVFVPEALQAAMNRQCGVTPEVFARYSGAARG